VWELPGGYVEEGLRSGLPFLDFLIRYVAYRTCGYMRQNITEEVWADIFDVAQSTVSPCITLLTPLIEKATERDRPTLTDATRALRGAIALVDGSLWPCWSWNGRKKLWSGKHKTTGHGSLIITNLQGRRAPVERAVADLKVWRVLFTDYRRPLDTFATTFRAATGLYFFKRSFA
jgi:hypothetical protein